MDLIKNHREGFILERRLMIDRLNNVISYMLSFLAFFILLDYLFFLHSMFIQNCFLYKTIHVSALLVCCAG